MKFIYVSGKVLWASIPPCEGVAVGSNPATAAKIVTRIAYNRIIPVYMLLG